jgi:hypothetical protein
MCCCSLRLSKPNRRPIYSSRARVFEEGHHAAAAAVQSTVTHTHDIDVSRHAKLHFCSSPPCQILCFVLSSFPLIAAAPLTPVHNRPPAPTHTTNLSMHTYIYTSIAIPNPIPTYASSVVVFCQVHNPARLTLPTCAAAAPAPGLIPMAARRAAERALSFCVCIDDR